MNQSVDALVKWLVHLSVGIGRNELPSLCAEVGTGNESDIDPISVKIAQANAQIDAKGRFENELVNCRVAGDGTLIPRDQVDYIDVSPKQVVSVAAALIRWQFDALTASRRNA